MKKFISLLLIVLYSHAYKAQAFGTDLEAKGILQDKAQIKKIDFLNKDIVFLPMHHLGTKKFYQDVYTKVDSLNKLGYFFYLEKVSADANKKEDLMKLRKILGMGIPTNGYQKALDLITSRIKSLKDRLTLQPDYIHWGLNETNSQNVDVTLSDLIRQYETQNGNIILENCDQKVPDITLNTRCRYDKMMGKAYNSVVLDFRNKLIVENLLKEKRQKIVLMYGDGHYTGIKKLIENSSGL